MQHILEPNKIMQLSNLKPRIAVKNNTSVEWNPLIASLYFLSPARLHNIPSQSRRCGRDMFTPSGLYFAGLDYIVRGQMNTAYNTSNLICQRIVP